jgi:hypothetical protein
MFINGGGGIFFKCMFYIISINTCQIPHCQIAKLHMVNVILVSFQINYNLQVAQIFVKLPKTKFLLVT